MGNSATVTYSGIENLKRVNSVEDVKQSILSEIKISIGDIEKYGIFIFGVGKLAQRVFDFFVSLNIKVNGFVDNNSEKQKSNFNGLKVISASELKSDDLVYIASATYFNQIYKQLLKQGLTRLISHMQAGILFYEKNNFPVEMYQQDLVRDLFENKQKYLEVFDLLEDDESKRVLDNILLFRLSLKQQYIDNIHTQLSKEYFDDDVINLSSDEVYMDIGGFDGDSAENFIHFVNDNYKAVHIFEPDKKLLDKAKVRLKEYKNIFYYDLGIFDKKTTLFFDVTGGLDGLISNQGTIKIETTTIDDCVEVRPTYIKFDVEGVEIEAIKGAVLTIKNKQPKLAIASYHYPKHLWEIPLLIKQINPAYKIKLRHYTDSVFDSIFYFI